MPFRSRLQTDVIIFSDSIIRQYHLHIKSGGETPLMEGVELSAQEPEAEGPATKKLRV